MNLIEPLDNTTVTSLNHMKIEGHRGIYKL